MSDAWDTVRTSEYDSLEWQKAYEELKKECGWNEQNEQLVNKIILLSQRKRRDKIK